MSKYREPCGCVHNGVKWLTFCENCALESVSLHTAAELDYRRTAGRDSMSISMPSPDWLGESIPDKITKSSRLLPTGDA